MRPIRVILQVAVLGLSSCSTTREAAVPVEVRPELAAAFVRADAALQAAVDEAFIPGAVLSVGWKGEIVHRRAFGSAQLYTADDAGEITKLIRPVPMTVDTVFDLASLTKVFATTFGVMLLVDRGKVRLDAMVSDYLPSFRGEQKDRVTMRHLLTHTAGLYQWKPIYYHAGDTLDDRRERVREYIGKLELRWPVGQRRHYSDLGFMLLGSVIEQVSGRRLDAFLAAELYEPLGLTTTGYLPRQRGLVSFAATSHGNPYEYKMVADDSFGYRCEENVGDFDRWRRRTLIGDVNDGNAFYANAGVAGHAGLFSDAADLHVLLDLLLGKGVYGGKRYISEAVVAEFLTRDRSGHGLGWAMSSKVLGAENLTAGAFGHTGFTGTYAVAVPEHGLTILLLTNRQNLGVDESGRYPNLGRLRKQIAEILIGACDR